MVITVITKPFKREYFKIINCISIYGYKLTTIQSKKYLIYQLIYSIKYFHIKKSNANKQLKLVDVDGSVKRLRFNSKEILNFKDLSKDFKHKHFVEVIIENQDIESIQDNHFSKISFDKVYIKKYQKLRIHWNAIGINELIKTKDAKIMIYYYILLYFVLYYNIFTYMELGKVLLHQIKAGSR